ncbi:hypothetical protein SV7mr_34120 [Stieleria bergensis]|uniref:Uncharacterized protein n=1 Tax=Stieleria bergensis TaxID=2528025 RepID=A0A517SXV3_9BACT|nr:hypothetical protein SV7mr_34120 [Planctomycetes bacterium SV_7m_r]
MKPSPAGIETTIATALQLSTLTTAPPAANRPTLVCYILVAFRWTLQMQLL